MTQSLCIFIIALLMIVFILPKTTKNRDYVDIVNFFVVDSFLITMISLTS